MEDSLLKLEEIMKKNHRYQLVKIAKELLSGLTKEDSQ